MTFRRLPSFFGFSSVVASAISWRRSARDLRQVHRRQQLADRLGADAGGEAVRRRTRRSPGCTALRVRSCFSANGVDARLDDDVVLEIENALEILERHVEQQADARGQRLQEPDVRDRRGELDVAHALAAHLGERHLDAALLADQALVLHALVLAAQALVVLDRPEDARAEQPVALRLERAVVDRLGLLDLAKRPRQDVVRAGDRDADLVEGRKRRLRLEEVGDLVHRLSPSRARPGPRRPFDGRIVALRVSRTGRPAPVQRARGRVARYSPPPAAAAPAVGRRLLRLPPRPGGNLASSQARR